MSSRLSRRVLAQHMAERLLDGDTAVMDELAALLISEGREREADILVRDIEDQLAESGQLVVTVESARKIDASVRKQVEQLFPGKKVHIREVVRPELIGGLKISTPSQVLDTTVRAKLKTLRETKI